MAFAAVRTPARSAVAAALSRRLVLRGVAASALVAAPPRRAVALLEGPPPEALLIAVADLHSPYRRLAAVLGGVCALRARFPGVPTVVAVNGDAFERGNVAALRSAGAADRAFLAALAADGPTVLNLGNHGTALEDEPAAVVARAEGLGLTMIGSVMDARTGRLFAPASARVGVGGRRFGLLGLAPDNPFVRRAPVRGRLTLLDPVAFAADAAPGAFAGADLPLVSCPAMPASRPTRRSSWACRRGRA